MQNEMKLNETKRCKFFSASKQVVMR